MGTDGESLRAYLDNMRLNKTSFAARMGITKQGLYQIFKSGEFGPDTIHKVEKASGRPWIEIKNGNVVGNVPREIKEPTSLYGRQDFKDKYLRQLEKSVRVEEELQSIKVSLNQLTVDMVALTERILQGQRELFQELTDFFRKSGSREFSPGAKRQRTGKS